MSPSVGTSRCCRRCGTPNARRLAPLCGLPGRRVRVWCHVSVLRLSRVSPLDSAEPVQHRGGRLCKYAQDIGMLESTLALRGAQLFEELFEPRVAAWER